MIHQHNQMVRRSIQTGNPPIHMGRPPIQTGNPSIHMGRPPMQTGHPPIRTVHPPIQTVRHPTTTSPTSPRPVSNPIPTAAAVVPAKRPRRLSDVGDPSVPVNPNPNLGFDSEAPEGHTTQPRSVDDQDMLNRIQLGQYQFPPAGDQSNNP
jgi:hypothetical protein